MSKTLLTETSNLEFALFYIGEFYQHGGLSIQPLNFNIRRQLNKELDNLPSGYFVLQKE